MNDHHDEMNDEKFDHWLHSAARDYNRPGDVPRRPCGRGRGGVQPCIVPIV